MRNLKTIVLIVGLAALVLSRAEGTEAGPTEADLLKLENAALRVESLANQATSLRAQTQLVEIAGQAASKELQDLVNAACKAAKIELGKCVWNRAEKKVREVRADDEK